MPFYVKRWNMYEDLIIKHKKMNETLLNLSSKILKKVEDCLEEHFSRVVKIKILSLFCFVRLVVGREKMNKFTDIW